jgi:hypothetical protein
MPLLVIGGSATSEITYQIEIKYIVGDNKQAGNQCDNI